ncbi:phospholipid scramblase-related protein [Streptomyces sp. NPDC059637]|uniref:phospholipid scramblase-related protein n=1 Tax=Streptomyces sp. NPDC059637 TaxID=3347752 RepID=UPI0036BA0F22
MTQSNTPAGWYPDPYGSPGLRWWDGSRWTPHTHAGDAPQQAAGAPVPEQHRPPADHAPGQHSPAPGPQVPGPHTPAQHYPAAQGPGQGTAQAPWQGPSGPYPQAPQQHIPSAPSSASPHGHPQQAHVPGQAPQGEDNPWELGVDGGHDPSRIQRQVQQQAGVAPAGTGGGTLFTEPVLVVNQKAKLIELSNEYGVFDQAGRTIGTVAEIGQSTARKVLRFVSSVDQFMTHRYEVRDAHGQVALHLTRPAKFMKSRMLVARADGTQVGEIAQQNVIGKINFAFLVDGQQIGAIRAENWRAWNFAIVDHNDVEVARITKTWEGLAKTLFTTADNYVLQIHHRLPDPLLSMVVASALTVDTALKQDSRGFG